MAYPTPYQATLTKTLPSGTVKIKGTPARSAKKAAKNLKLTKRQYRASGGWGGGA